MADVIFCTNCGTKNESTSIFCMNCGARLAEPQAQPSLTSPRPPTQTAAFPSAPSAFNSKATPPPQNKPHKKRNRIIIVIASVVVALLIATGLYFFVFRPQAATTTALQACTSASKDYAAASEAAQKALKEADEIISADTDLLDSSDTDLTEWRSLLTAKPNLNTDPDCSEAASAANLTAAAEDAQKATQKLTDFAEKLTAATKELTEEVQEAKSAEERADEGADDPNSTASNEGNKDTENAPTNDMTRSDLAAAPLEIYTNTRFGFSVGIPKGFVWGGESDNGDGQVFTAPDGSIVITTSGSFNALGSTSQDEFNNLASGHTVSYKLVTDGAVVVSYEENHTITYIKSYVTPDAIKTINFEYSTGVKEAGNTIVDRVAGTFK